MTPHQKRVEATKRAMIRVYYAARKNDQIEALAAWHLRMGGRAPGETCANCVAKAVVTCGFCSRKYKDNWRPKGGAR